MMVSEIGRQDTLSIFNNPAQAALQSHNENNNSEIDAGEFTYSKLIIRDQNGIGKSPMIKELKYVPVCDRSMKKRKLSQLQEEWTRLGGVIDKSMQ